MKFKMFMRPQMTKKMSVITRRSQKTSSLSIMAILSILYSMIQLISSQVFHLVDEKKVIGLLRRLYDFRFTVPGHIEVIGGRTVNLLSFHYRGVNAQNKTIKSKVLTFIDKDEKEELYRWELKGALITQFGNVSTLILILN